MKFGVWILLWILAQRCQADDSGLPAKQQTQVEILTKITCSLSIIFAASIVICYLCFEELKHKLLRALVIGLSLCDLGTGLVDVLPHQSEKLCKAQALLGMYFPMASFIYTDAIGLMIYLTVIESRGKDYLAPFILYVHLVSLLLPLLFIIIIAAFDVEGDDNGFGTGVCWISIDHQNWRLLGGKLLEWCSWFFVMTVYLTTLYKLKKMVVQHDTRSTSFKLLFIPAIFIFLRVPSAIRTIHDYLYGESPLFWLAIFQALGDYGQGFANGLWFLVFQSEARRLILEHICFCKKTADKTSMASSIQGDSNSVTRELLTSRAPSYEPNETSDTEVSVNRPSNVYGNYSHVQDK